jgi:hypothetical protein
MNIKPIFSTVATIFLASAGCFGLAQAADPVVYSRDTVVSGRTYSEWSAAWQQWAISMPTNKHPLFDAPTKVSCAVGQSGPVWFLGGRFCPQGPTPTECDNSHIERSCTVPAGKSLYFPILNISCLDVEAKNGACTNPANKNAAAYPAQIRAALEGHIDSTTGLKLTVDGQTVSTNLKRDFRVQSPVFTVATPANNLYYAMGEKFVTTGDYWGMDDGVYVMLKPLSKGTHEIKFQGTFPVFNFSLDVTYHITQE